MPKALPSAHTANKVSKRAAAESLPNTIDDIIAKAKMRKIELEKEQLKMENERLKWELNHIRQHSGKCYSCVSDHTTVDIFDENYIIFFSDKILEEVIVDLEGTKQANVGPVEKN